MASTEPEHVLRFRLQMAEQSRRLGERIKELRERKDWKQRDLVDAMNEAGDLALNTNQLSRYENGGAFPNETRLERFALALETDVGTLLASPKPATEAEGGDLMESLSEAEPGSLAKVEAMLREVLNQQAALLGDISEVRSEQERLSPLIERLGRGRAAKRS